MAKKTFISYKYSEAQKLRDEILKKLGKDAVYYQGETSESPNLTNLTTEGIKSKLKDMIYNTTVTIVIISPNIKASKWIDWEIEYSLKEVKRNIKTSKTNGIIAIIQKVNDTYDWFIEYGTNCHGNNILRYKQNLIYDIIKNNHFNSNPGIWHCDECKTYSYDEGSYISYIEEDIFLNNPSYYIETAYDKSQNLNKYDLVKQK